MRRSIGFFIVASLLSPGMLLASVPVQEYETSLPGYFLGRGLDVVVDKAGNAFGTASYYEDEHTLDILAFKLDENGNPLWVVPIGEDNSVHDYPTGIALDADGHLWMTGFTSSETFPVTPDALDGTLTGFTDVFLLQLDANDGSVRYGTYLGGDYDDRGGDIFIDGAGTIYLTGYAGSTDFPTTPDAYQTEPSAPLYIFQDAFITKLSPDGRTILYSTYFGGFEDDWGENIAVDPDGNIVISGSTNADDFPLANPIQTTPDRIFISKLSADGSEVLFSTYLGGENVDYLRGMDMDAAGFVYLTGSTRSVSFPTTPGALQEEFVGDINGCEEGFPGTPVNCFDGFLTKLGTDGSGIQYSTYLGGSINDEGSSVAVNAVGEAHVVGYTGSADFLGAGNASSAIFVAGITPSGSALDYALTVESGSANSGHGIAVDASNNVFFSGAVGVPYDIYVAKLHLAPLVSTGEPGTVPAALSLGPNVPNPFTRSTALTYSIADPGGARARLAVYDASGRLVRTLVDGVVSAGEHAASWDGLNGAGELMPPGVYFHRLEASGATRTGRMILVR